MRPIGIFLALAVAMEAGCALASEDYPPVRTKNGDVIFIAHSGGAVTGMKTGLNPIDQPKQFRCRSKFGCIVVLSANVVTSGFNTAIGVCAFVDSKPAKPSCKSLDGGLTIINRQIERVRWGQHTVYTDLDVWEEYYAGYIESWETDYTIYELDQPSGGD